MRRLSLFLAVAAMGCSAKQTKAPPVLESANGLESAASFAAIENDEQRARALFAEMSKVIQHPRCLNCHPVDGSPLQGDDMKPHQPLVVRGDDGFGAAGMRCTTCHGADNFENVPGNPHWHLAPAEMGWVGKSTTEICEQLKDPARNGGKSLDEVVRHMTEDPLVGWGWSPPKHLAPALGNQALLGDLTRAWVSAGAHCP